MEYEGSFDYNEVELIVPREGCQQEAVLYLNIVRNGDELVVAAQSETNAFGFGGFLPKVDGFYCISVTANHHLEVGSVDDCEARRPDRVTNVHDLDKKAILFKYFGMPHLAEAALFRC